MFRSQIRILGLLSLESATVRLALWVPNFGLGVAVEVSFCEGLNPRLPRLKAASKLGSRKLGLQVSGSFLSEALGQAGRQRAGITAWSLKLWVWDFNSL